MSKMKRSAYLTTSLAIKTLANLSKADIVIHGEDNIPSGPVIFVINHFTRIETFLLPYHIYQLTHIPVRSLAASSLFKGGLSKFFDMVGVISTKDPKRDELILKGLLTGEENWILFPEGSMVKTKKTMRKGKYVVSASTGKHEPHTGAASLALRAEFFRKQVLEHEQSSPEAVASFLQQLDIDSCDQLRDKTSSIVPVNLTYYPIRAKENLASSIASKFVKDLPERVIEELMTEGTMLLSGVDLDIRFGKPIPMSGFMDNTTVVRELRNEPKDVLEIPFALDSYMRDTSHGIMLQYMRAIYGMTTINHEHLFASFVKLYPYKKIREKSLISRVFYAASLIADSKNRACNLHRSLKESQIHLLTDDRYSKFKKFLDLALEKKILVKENGFLKRSTTYLSNLIAFHRRRIDNPIEVIANEVEPLKKLQDFIFSIAWRPDFIVKRKIVKYLIQKDQVEYQKDLRKQKDNRTEQYYNGKPYLLKSFSRKIGVVLIHSYLSVPEEVRTLAQYLHRKGFCVYAPRLAGHGTTPMELAKRNYRDWLRSVETGFSILDHMCERVVVGGISVGGCLALDLASRIRGLDGVFTVCSPYKLQDYSTSFMPTMDVWKRILTTVKGDSLKEKFLDFQADNPHVNYGQNPVVGVREVGRFLDHLKERLPEVSQPSLIIHADKDPVVEKQAATNLYDNLGSTQKDLTILSNDRHIIINGEGAGKTHRMIGDFVSGI